jgi:NAD-dependent deacetylase
MTAKTIVLFTGAGTSAEAGLSTFRNNTNNKTLWDEYDVDIVCNMKNFKSHKEEVKNFYNMLRNKIKESNPTQFHKAVKIWQDELLLKDYNLIILTQNIDDLFERADVKNVYHVHGEITYSRCLGKNHRWKIGYENEKIDDRCPICNSSIKTDVVFFNESTPMYEFAFKILKNLTYGDFLIVSGTSENVFPLRNFLLNFRITKIYNNIEMTMNNIYNIKFIEPCTTAIYKIKDYVNNIIEKTITMRNEDMTSHGPS